MKAAGPVLIVTMLGVSMGLADTGAKPRKPRLAVADFRAVGEVGVKDAGKAVAELLLSCFSTQKYQLVERSRLTAILDEHKLTMAEIVSNPALLRGKKLKGVRYLVVGSVVKFGKLTISARLVDVTTADIIQTATVSAEDARSLQEMLGALVTMLHMKPGDKKILDVKNYPILLVQAREAAAQARAGTGSYERALDLYGCVLAVRTTKEVQAELRKLQADHAAHLKKQAENRQRDQAFAELLAKAKKIVESVPAAPGALTPVQKAQLQSALQTLRSALTYKPADPKALALKMKIYSTLGRSMPKELTLDLGQGVSLKLALISVGKFTMGSPEGVGSFDERPRHEVTIAQPFHLGVTEVTQAQWRAVMGTAPWKRKSYVKEGADCPATYVSWAAATAFCKKLSARAGGTVRLPTEAEWEYACRAGSKTRYSFGDDDSKLGDYAWYEENAWDQDEKHAHPVARKKPNPWGLYDVHGNVWEWCWDWYGEKHYTKQPQADPKGPPTGVDRVARGGSWDNFSGAQGCRSAYRFKSNPSQGSVNIGLRIVLSSTQP